MRLRCFLLTTCFFYAIFCSAQKKFWPQDNNAVSFELGKSGLIYNFTFDHKFQNQNFGFIIGLGSNLAKYLNLFKIGGGPYFLVGQTNNFLEMGIDVYYLVVDEVSDDQKGFAIVYPNYSVQSYYATFNLGYRHISTTKLYRIGISPGFIKNDFVPGAYLSFGILF
jgi:hypothetical protein